MWNLWKEVGEWFEGEIAGGEEFAGLQTWRTWRKRSGNKPKKDDDLAAAPVIMRNLMFPGEAVNEVWKELLKERTIKRKKVQVR